MPTNYTVIGSSIAAASGAAPAAPAINSVTVIAAEPDGNGQPQVRVTLNYSAPGALGSFHGSEVFLDHPDSSIGLSIADGTQAADGTTAAAGTFNPDDIGFYTYDATNPLISFVVPAPRQAEFWRVYLVPGTAGFVGKPIQNGQAGASPSFQFQVQPPSFYASGREYAPLIQNPALASPLVGWDANPHVVIADSGDQYFEYAVTWTWPTNDQNYQTVGGINLVLDDGTTQKYLGNIGVNLSITQYVSPHITLRPGTTAYRLWFVTYDVNGRNNLIVSGVTPSVTFSVTRASGGSGKEYCALVTSDGVNAFVTAAPVSGADGTSLLRVTGYFARPSDPQFGGVEIVVLKPDAVYYSVAKGTLSPIQNDISQPAAVESWTFYLRSIDINGRLNSIQPGITPSITISVGNASGQLNLSKAAGTSFSAQFAIVGSVFQVSTLDAVLIKTGNLQVGGGVNMPGQMKVYDHLGSLIGWIGDDTGSSGFVGAWFKQLRAGGASPSGAPLVCDSSGNFSLTLASGTVTLNVDATNFLKLVDTSNTSKVSWQGGGIWRAGNTADTVYSQLNPTQISIHNGSATVVQLNNSGIMNFRDTGGSDRITLFANSSSPTIAMNGTQVLTTQQSDPGAPSFAVLSDAQTWAASLRTSLRNHGLI